MLTIDILTNELRRQGYLRNGSITHFERGERFNSSADEVYRLHLAYSSDAEPSAPHSLICKQLAAPTDNSQPLYELFFHETLAPQMPEVPVVASFGAIRDGAGTTHLLLEDLNTHYSLATPPPSLDQLAAVTDLLADLHAHWWQHPLLESPQLLTPDQSVCRMPQIVGKAAARANFATAQKAATHFLQKFEDELTNDEKRLLKPLSQKWGDLILERISRNQPITLIHGDFHLLGNIFFARDPAATPAIKIIDWAQSKRGIGAHDLMYTLLSADSANRVERDTNLLRRYHDRLCAAGIVGYPWQQCLWDFQFSQLTSIFQSVFQESLRWFRKTFEVIESWGSTALFGS